MGTTWLASPGKLMTGTSTDLLQALEEGGVPARRQHQARAYKDRVGTHLGAHLRPRLQVVQRQPVGIEKGQGTRPPGNPAPRGGTPGR